MFSNYFFEKIIYYIGLNDLEVKSNLFYVLCKSKFFIATGRTK